MIKNLQIGDTDITGRRFNGHDLHLLLAERGVHSEHCVWTKESDDPNTWKLSDFRDRNLVHDAILDYEKRFSLQGLLHPFAYQLFFDKRFLTSDVVHYHLIHNEFFNFSALPFLTHLKPSVWTIHDPWAMTGHCVHPYACEGWKQGCFNCPYKDIPSPITHNSSALAWKMKEFYYKASSLDIIVASPWMKNLIKESPLLSHFETHAIPFGIDQKIFYPREQLVARAKFGLPPDCLVICFRASMIEFKGTQYIIEALLKLRTQRPICLLTFEETGLLRELRRKYKIVELGWVNDQNLMAEAYSASDFFLMPSTAEAFGMMAVEAMACGKPAIVFEGTALPGTVHAPEAGISVPARDSQKLMEAIELLVNNSELRSSLGKRALEVVQANYSYKTYVDKILAVYDHVAKKHKLDENYKKILIELQASSIEFNRQTDVAGGRKWKRNLKLWARKRPYLRKFYRLFVKPLVKRV